MELDYGLWMAGVRWAARELAEDCQQGRPGGGLVAMKLVAVQGLARHESLRFARPAISLRKGDTQFNFSLEISFFFLRRCDMVVS